MSKDYVPHNDGEFDHWLDNLVQYVTAKTGTGGCCCAQAEWDHIPAVLTDELRQARDEWKTHYTPSLQPHTPAITTDKNDARARAEKVIRPFVQRFLHWSPVTNGDRVNMGLPNHDAVRTPHIDVNETVEFEIKLRNIRELLVDFWVKGSERKAKPDGYDGAVMLWDALDKPPERPEELNRHALASRTPHTIEFDETERGKTVYIALSWQNQRGHTGQWSEIQTAIVP